MPNRTRNIQTLCRSEQARGQRPPGAETEPTTVEGRRKSGYAIISGEKLEVKESGPLSPSWSAQACELYALFCALLLLKDREGTIYTESKYAFGVVQTFRKIWKERGLLNTQRKGLVHQGLIIQILKALRSPKKIAVVHVKVHQRGRGIKTRRNNLADDEAKKASLRENSNVIMTFQEAGTQNQTPYFPLAEVEAMKNLGATLEEGQWILPDKTTVQTAEKG
ncbi:hypothetical protein DUI87_32511 [Hirundo rustica rustica]|uniref:RNase H type-1 domain-containing protein n=1 Tax=Hirundo rustica rustica TaxID=333673 RepID=A0A3M0INW7_HIRRU|nr:hypothetical protein DUI87_32511 [Hirundo rustica rustica]